MQAGSRRGDEPSACPPEAPLDAHDGRHRNCRLLQPGVGWGRKKYWCRPEPLGGATNLIWGQVGMGDGGGEKGKMRFGRHRDTEEREKGERRESGEMRAKCRQVTAINLMTDTLL